MDFFKRHRRLIALSAILVVTILYIFLCAPPSNFPSQAIITLPRGASVSQIATQLTDAHIVRHPSVLKLVLFVSGAAGHVQAGTYLFDTKESVISVARRLATGDYDLPPVSVTFPEGITVREMAEKIAEEVSPAVAEELLTLGKSQEGYLFPDTYLLPPDATAASILETMRATFDAKTSSLASDVQASGHAFADIITLASLVEKEARTDENRRIVAGVLWNRLAKKMPLQVDAVFGYINDRDTYSPSYADLKADSPYNTYTHTGLPPGPICNPGLMSILAALHPTTTKYLYYLTDKNGVMRYATTFAEHQANRQKYPH